MIKNKLKTVSVDLSKLSNVVNNDDVKKKVHDKLVTKINNIGTTGFVLKTKYTTDKSDVEKKISDAEKKIPNTSFLVKKTDYNSKITEIEGKKSGTSSLVTNAALTAFENKIPDVSYLVKKTDYNTKISEIESKYITAAGYNKFTKDIVDNSIKNKNLVTKTDFNAKMTSFNKKSYFK